MEFKVFKNETGKILKEYWLTPSEWEALDKTAIQEGDIYHIVGTIDKGDLSADVNASLAKGDSSLQKPTATLAKESFVKVGIDGTQKFDDTVYAKADSLNILEAKLNENIIKNPSKTYLIWKGSQFPNRGSSATFKAPAGCVIDWGDGNVETFGTASTVVNTHNYTDGIEYHLISLSNYTVFSDEAFSYCSGLTSITISSSVTSIGKKAFRGCTGLISIAIPDSVTSIGDSAFWDCSGLTSVIIGNGVTSIGNVAFFGCNKLKIIRMSAINPPTLGSNAFETSIEKIIVPKSAINAYKSAAGWSIYADKIVYEVDSSDLGNLEIDTEMSDQSTNAVQNKVIKAYIDGSIFTNGIPATKILYSGNFSKTVETAISCRFYWGDGTFTDYINATDISHTYSDQLTLHTISIVGLTSIPDSMFADDTELYEITLGVGVSADMTYFANCTSLKTIRIQDNNADALPITTNDMSVFTYNFDYANFRIVVPRLLYVKLLETNANISTEFIWNFVVPDDSYICSHSIQLSGSNNATYEVMLYSTCKFQLNQVPLATDPSTGTDKKRDILRELVDGEIAYKYSGDIMDGLGSLIYSDSDNKYHISLSTFGGSAKTDEAFDLTEIISDTVKLK